MKDRRSNMKKKVLVCLAVVTLVLTSPSACGNADVQQTRLIFATGGTGGTYFPFGGVIAGVINNETDLNVTPNASGASVDNLQQIVAGDAHIVFAQNDISYYAFTATEIWSGMEPAPELRALMALHSEPVQIVVPANSDIYSVEDLSGQRVSIGDVGSGVEANSIQILGVHGLTLDDIQVFNLGPGPSADAMREDSIDAFFLTALAPSAAVMELAVRLDLRLIPIDDTRVEMLAENFSFYAGTFLGPEHYEFITEPIQTVTVHAQLVVSEDLDEDVVYTIVRTIIEHKEAIAEGHRAGEYIDAEHAVTYISIPLHPGAHRFFREAGVVD
jgi:TRAP transporter TAXI family solute receptor